ncbi:MAG: NifB/NifX family molybdenum-iron cluster-binding protein [Phycisphaeraceae bacterium]|nr:NifB/NifX family molybdenum-iron cluster-binding protein [Phycisphaeraceae bacterium]
MKRIAVPLEGDQLCPHFGGAPAMAFFDADVETRSIVSRRDLPTPPHQPGVLPRWLAQQGAEVVLAGGIGERAVIMLADAGIKVVQGAAVQPAVTAVQAWLDNRLTVNPEPCHHDHHGGGHGHDCQS